MVTQLKAGTWEKQLQELPNCECAEFVFHGLRERFRIGFDQKRVKCCSTKANMLSAAKNPLVVGEYLAKELAYGRATQKGWRFTSILLG